MSYKRKIGKTKTRKTKKGTLRTSFGEELIKSLEDGNKMLQEENEAFEKGWTELPFYIGKPEYPKAIVRLEGEPKNRIIVYFEKECYDCQSGEKIDFNRIKSTLGRLEDFLDEYEDYYFTLRHIYQVDDEGTKKSITRSHIYIINKEKWEEVSVFS